MGVGKAFLLAVPILIIVLGYKLNSLLEPPPLPKLDENAWWGPDPRNETEDKLDLKPFKILVHEQVLDYLQWRLKTHRPLTPPLEGVQHQYGINTRLLTDIVSYWRTEYNWTQRQEYLNKFPQYHINVQGLDVHVVHVNPKVEPGIKIVPLLLLHGWPGSVREFYEVIPKLTTLQKGRKYMFEVIAPHIPGFGFSQSTSRPGLGSAQIAVLLKNLMNKLGFKTFYIQGGDFGAVILQHMAVLYPEAVLGFHSNMCTVHTPKAYLRTLLSIVFPSWYIKPEHYDRVFPIQEKFITLLRETGHLHIQATKPDTIGVAIDDSPIGLAAYILEKFIAGTNVTFLSREDGGLTESFSYRDLLDNVMIYFVSSSATTSFRLYAETFNQEHIKLNILRHPIKVPSACARFSNEIYIADGFLDEIYPNLVQLTDHDGGHFAAFQLPDVFANDLYDALEKFEKFNKENRPEILKKDESVKKEPNLKTK